MLRKCGPRLPREFSRFQSGTFVDVKSSNLLLNFHLRNQKSLMELTSIIPVIPSSWDWKKNCWTKILSKLQWWNSHLTEKRLKCSIISATMIKQLCLIFPPLARNKTKCTLSKPTTKQKYRGDSKHVKINPVGLTL